MPEETSKAVRSTPSTRWGPWLIAALSAVNCTPALAVFTFSSVTVAQRQITLRIGTTGPTINNVVFPVTGALVGTGPIAASTGGVLVEVEFRKPVTPSPAQAQSLSVNSSTPLSCVVGSGCGTTTVPMSNISWVSTVLQTGTYAGWDVPSGTFNNSGSQLLFSRAINPLFQGIMTVSNTLTFTYANTSVLPAGNYTARVVFTATAL